jgi:CheY-like chemotaxis protein
LTIEADIAEGVPPMLIGDAGRLRQILVNLLGNAVKFTERGCVILRADTLAPTRPDRVRLRVRVQDTGIGIAPETIGNLFIKFSQLDGSITRRFGGTGLGLAISRELVERMGGEITVTSTLGEGSTFTVVIDLPVAESSAAPESPTIAAVVVGEASSEGLDVLLAEDNPTNTLVATRLLQKMGHRVSAVVDGEAALAAVSRRHFDVVLMDVMMPRMDGLVATRRIRAGAALDPDVPIVALTANALAEDRRAALDAGANAYATKPVSMEKLMAAIAEAMTSAPKPGVEGEDGDEVSPTIRAIA